MSWPGSLAWSNIYLNPPLRGIHACPELLPSPWASRPRPLTICWSTSIPSTRWLSSLRSARQINSYNLQLQQNMIQFVGPVVDVQPDEKPLAVSLREINEGLLSLEANPEA